jgi:hypothetical protein
LLKRDLEIKEHELKLVEEQVGGSNASRVSFSLSSVGSFFSIFFVDCGGGW